MHAHERTRAVFGTKHARGKRTLWVNIRKWFSDRQKRKYYLHITGTSYQEIKSVVEQIIIRHHATNISKTARGYQTLSLRTNEVTMREIQESIPDHIVASYEPVRK